MASILAQFAGNSEFDFSGELGIYSLFGFFNRVPKTLALSKLFWIFDDTTRNDSVGVRGLPGNATASGA